MAANLPTTERSIEIAISHISTELTCLLECLRCILAEWEDYLNHLYSGGAYSYSATISTPLRSGRPRLDISKFLCEKGILVTSTDSLLLGCMLSPYTVHTHKSSKCNKVIR